MWWIALLLFLFVNMIVVIFTRLFFTISYIHKSDGDFLSIELRFWRWVRLKKEIPMVTVDKEEMTVKTKQKEEYGQDKKEEEEKDYSPEDIKTQLESVKDFLDRVVGFHRILRRFLSKVHVHTLLWDTQVGTSEASTTGMLCGGIWTLKGSIVAFISSYMQLNTAPELYVTPYFQQKHSQTRIKCMISFRFGQAILAVFLIVRHTQGRVPKFRKKTA
ncbi:DUF2953 domain-containing protein [Pontibacillus sp. HMF3514]|uniref:DUF2953 domain-containing protein n=1 Tax=Pontibacillus sp. HMF3514 TaxID=2692425 RepID=UPI00131FF593|nr:DUF2953 domain-containing protein [Pontibacillus sp. HMF3514]QHE53263.1 DUF2953 domain-containing protein [Pontibacillus sp. HMF3514]